MMAMDKRISITKIGIASAISENTTSQRKFAIYISIQIFVIIFTD